MGTRKKPLPHTPKGKNKNKKKTKLLMSACKAFSLFA